MSFGGYTHVVALIQKPDGEFEPRFSRYPDTWGPGDGWSKIEAEVRNDLSCGHKLIALLLDERHEHPLSIINGRLVAGEHMP